MTALFSLTQQQKLWWRDFQLNPKEGLSWATWVLDSRLEEKRAVAALKGISERHEILRTSFPKTPTTHFPPQKIWPSPVVNICRCETREDLAKAGATEAIALLNWVGGHASVQLTLYYFIEPDGTTLCRIFIPGIQVDRQSLEVLVEEWFATYSGSPPPEEEVLQYADFEAWQTDMLAEDTAEALAAKAYWKSQTVAAPQRLNRRYRAGKDATFACGAQEVMLDSQALSRLSHMADAQGLELQDLFLTGFSVVMQRLGWLTDIELYWVHPGRKYEGMEAAPGPYATPLPLSVSTCEDSHWRKLAQEIHQRRTQADTFQEYFQETESATREPVVFSWALAEKPSQNPIPGLEIQEIAHHEQVFLWKWAVQGTKSRPKSTLFFNTQRIGTLDAKLVADSLAELFACDWAGEDLSALVANPNTCLLTDFANQVNQQERHTAKLFHQQFEEHAAATPSAIALVSGDTRYTYAHLNAWSNHIAELLLGAQARSTETAASFIVGLNLGREPLFLAAVLGALKIGACYLPLDPEWPVQRRCDLLRSAKASLLVGEPLDGWMGAVLKLPSAPPESHDIYSNPHFPVMPLHPAYVLFTSGSTGLPKGVQVSAGNLAAYVQAVSSRLHLHQSQHFGMLATLYADLGYTTVFPPLYLGKTLHLVTESERMNPQSFAKLNQQTPLDVIKITPSHLKALMAGKHDRAVLPAQVLILGGETPDPDFLQHIRALAPDLKIYNHYGPTETTVGVVAGQLENLEPPIALGHPLASAQVYVLNHQGQLQVPGLVGELAVSGDTVAQGYVGQPGQTALHFQPNPFVTRKEEFGSRLYTTGDQVYVNSCLQLVFMGRKDEQVKIRGFRVELPEITHALLRHPEIREACTQILPTEPQQLVAYWCDSEPLSAEAVKAHLETLLPSYMIPHALVRLESLPLNANGKINRKALPLPSDQGSKDLGKPRNETERLLLEVVQGVLKHQNIGIFDNFFRQGGDSIQSILVVARSEALGLRFTVEDMFKHQTVAKLAQQLEAIAPATTSSAALTYQDFGFSEDQWKTFQKARKGTTALLPLAPVQEGLLFHALYERGSRAYLEQKMVRFEGNLNTDAFATAWNGLLHRHTALTAGFDWETLGKPVQFLGATTQIPLKLCDWRTLSEAAQKDALKAFLEEDRALGFTLDEPPLMRLTLIQTKEDGWLFVWSHHHLLLDGWSLPILLQDWKKAYLAACEGLPLAADPPPQYATFLHWLQRQNSDASEQMWRHALAGFAQPTYLYRDHREDAVSLSDVYEYQHLTLLPDVFNAAESWLQSRGITVNTWLQTSWGLTLAQTMHRNDMVFGTTVSGRPPSLEGVADMVGMFINSMPVRISLDRDIAVKEWASLHQDTQVRLRETNHIPLVTLQKWSNLPPGSALFDHLLIFENIPGVRESLKNQDLGSATMALVDFSAQEKTNYTLILKIMPQHQGLHLEIMHDAARISAVQVKRLLKRFSWFLEAMVTHSDESPTSLLAKAVEREASQRPVAAAKRFQANVSRV